jgi:uncharacterized damage-inducible protein DinB
MSTQGEADMMTPEERRQKIVSYGAAYDKLVAALDRYPAEMWSYRPAPGRWTIHEIIVHIADSEANSYIRARRFLAEPGSAVLGYDEEGWARALNYHDQNPADALELFRWLRYATFNLIQGQPDAVWANTVHHSESGLMTMDDWLVTYESHIPDHIGQMEAVYQAWLNAGRPAASASNP